MVVHPPNNYIHYRLIYDLNGVQSMWNYNGSKELVVDDYLLAGPARPSTNDVHAPLPNLNIILAERQDE